MRRKRRRPAQKFNRKMRTKLMVLFSLILAVLCGLIGRLTYIEHTKGETYQKKVLSMQSYDSKTIPYQRGEIIDRSGTVLATSVAVYNVILDCTVVNDKEEYVHWNRIHGKHRKIVKFECKKEKKKIRDGILTFNHFAGREDVMCIRVDTSHSENGKGFLYQIKSLPYFLTMNPSYRNEAFSSNIYDIYLKVDSEVAQAYLKHQEMTDNAEKVQS